MHKRLIRLAADNEAASFFQDITDVIGSEIADKLQRLAGGIRVSIPRPSKLTERSKLSRIIGYDDAKRIVEELAPEGQTINPIYVPLGNTSRTAMLKQRVDDLLQQDGITVQEVALRTGVHMRTVHRRKSHLRKAGKRLGDPAQASKESPPLHLENKGALIVRTLLLEGYSPSLLRGILNVPGDVILTARAELLREGKLR